MAENTPIFTQPPGHRCGYWDILMSKSWRDLDPVITFPAFDQMMLNRMDCGVMGWTLFRLTRFGRAEAVENALSGSQTSDSRHIGLDNC